VSQKNNLLQFRSIEGEISHAIALFDRGDTEDAICIFKSLAKKDDSMACFLLGFIYERGIIGVESDINKAIRYYEHAIEVDDKIDAYLSLGRIYYRSENRDLCKAFDYYSQAAFLSEDLNAEYMLGRMFFYGQCVEKDYKMAETYLKSAYSKEHYPSLILLSKIEIRRVRIVKSLLMRLRAFKAIFKISGKDLNDPRIRYF